MDTASGSRSLPLRFEQAILTKEPATVEQLTVVYECMAAQLDAASASLRQATIATSTRVAAATLEEHRDARVNPWVTQLRALLGLIKSVDARLTFMETPLERQPVRPLTPPQGFHEDARPRSPTIQYVSFTPPKAADTPSVALSYAMGSGTLQEMATYPPYTDPLHNPLHQLQKPLFTQQVSQPFSPTFQRRFAGQLVSPYPYHHPSLHGHPTSATALPVQPQFPPFENPYHPSYTPFTSGGNHAYAHTAPWSPLDTLGLLFPGFEPVHTLVPLFAKVMSYRLYRLSNTSARVFGSQETCIDKQLEWFRNVTTDFVTFDGSRPITLLKFLKNIRTGFNEAFVSGRMALLMFGRLVSSDAGRLYSPYVSVDVRFNRLSGTVSCPGLVPTYLQRYLTDSVLSEAANKVSQIRQQPDEDKKTYGDRFEEYAAECSWVYSDDMLVNYFVQGLLPTTPDTITEALHRMTIDQRSSLSNVVRLAQAECQTYRARDGYLRENGYTTIKPETSHAHR